MENSSALDRLCGFIRRVVRVVPARSLRAVGCRRSRLVVMFMGYNMKIVACCTHKCKGFTKETCGSSPVKEPDQLGQAA